MVTIWKDWTCRYCFVLRVSGCDEAGKLDVDVETKDGWHMAGILPPVEHSQWMVLERTVLWEDSFGGKVAMTVVLGHSRSCSRLVCISSHLELSAPRRRDYRRCSGSRAY